MFERVGTERLIELLLAGAPARVVDGLAAASQEDTAELAVLREDLARLALAAPPAEPSARLRERLLAARPRPLRPQRPVVVVLDMIQDYLQPGGPLEVPRARDIVPALKLRLTEARALKVP